MGEPHGASALLRLRLSEDVSGAIASERPSHPHGGVLPINIRPLEAEQLTTPHASMDGESCHVLMEWLGPSVRRSNGIRRGTTNLNQPKGNTAQPEKPWSFYLVVVAILSVTVAFLVIVVLYSRLDIFDKDNAANITAALSSLFGIVGTLVGAYFGIKATTDTQGKLERTQSETLAATQETVKDVTQKSLEHQKQVVEQQRAAAATVEAATSAAPQGATGLNPTSLALASLVPVVGGASLLVLRYYLRRMQDAA